MVLDIKLSNEELLSYFHQNETQSEEDEIARLTELYHFADFGRLSAGLFHDLATPLNVVLINLEQLKEKCENLDDEKIFELESAIDRAFNGTERMMRFLELARSQVQRKKILSMFSVNDEILQAIKMISETSDNELEINFSSNEEVNIFGNSTQLFQVILNLLSNSKDSYLKNSELKKILVSLNTSSKGCQIIVQDWGSGIKIEDQSKVFQPFFTTKLAKNGSGIGLFISRDVVQKQFKGKLSFISNESGTLFTIDLPRRTSIHVSE